MYEDVKSENLVAYLIHRGPAEPNHWFRTVPIGQSSVSIIGGLVEPDVVSVEQPTIRETEVFGLETTRVARPVFGHLREIAYILNTYLLYLAIYPSKDKGIGPLTCF